MLLPGILVANVGVPMLVLLWPAQWLAWVPMTLLQAELGHRRLQLPRGAALRIVSTAKLAATAFGVPLTWAVMLGVQLALGAGLAASGILNEDALDGRVLGAVTWPLRAAWLAPTENAWQVYLAFAVLLVPCCWVSFSIESLITRRMLPTCEPRTMRAWIQIANVLSCLLLLLAAAVYPVAMQGRAW
jgi:hypothetical protein